MRPVAILKNKILIFSVLFVGRNNERMRVSGVYYFIFRRVALYLFELSI